MPHDLERIRATLNLVTLAEQAGAHLKQIGNTWRGNCPLHGGDNPNAFVIFFGHGGKMFWTCFSGDCNERGKGNDEFAFLMAQTGKPLKDILNDLDTGTPLPMPVIDETERRLRALEIQVAEQERRLHELENWQKSEPWQRYHDNASETIRETWRKAGIPDDWQRFWKLGGTEEFSYLSNEQRYTSPTLTIPIWEQGWKCLTVRHRILNPHDPQDKYRPDCPGLGSHPFLADPDLGYEVAGRTIVVEGEKKAAVTFLTLDLPLVQVIGLPGKAQYRTVAEKLKGRSGVFILLDPDAEDKANALAHEIGGANVVHFNRKIDDTIVKYNLSGDWLIGLLQTGKMVK